MLLAYVLLWTSALIVGSVICVHVVSSILALFDLIFNRSNHP